MNEHLDAASEELKRADHLIFVSLKYTRTCDVIKHVIERLINCIDFTFTALLEDLKEKGKIDEVPKAPIPKSNMVKEQFAKDALVSEFADLFIRFRKISKADFSRECEFRRHVAMTVIVEDEVIKIDIDIITDYFKRTKDLYAHAQSLIEPEAH